MLNNVFTPNNHSKWKIDYRSTPQELSRTLEVIFMRHYGADVDRVISIEQVDEAEINSNNFRVRYEKGGKEESLLLRRYRNDRDRAMLEEIAGVLSDLRKTQLRVPEIALSKSGKIIEVEGEYSFTAYHFIKGDHFRGTLSEIADVAQELGKLDTLLGDLPSARRLESKVVFPKNSLMLREYDEETWKKLFAKAKEGLSDSTDPTFDQRLLNMEGEILRALEATPREDEIPFKKQVVHFDLHPHNLITDGARLFAIIDLDSLRMTERMRAVAFALHRLVRQYVVNTSPADVEKAVKEGKMVFMDAYRIHGTFTDEEMAAVPYFIRNEALARLSYAMKDNYFNGNPAWKGDLEKQTMSIREAGYFV